MDLDEVFSAVERITVTGDLVSIQGSEAATALPQSERVVQAFGRGTWDRLRSMKVGVVGCSGTGSLVVEQLARTGVGHLLLIDPDRVEHRNLNRIVNSRWQDVENRRFKVDVLADSIREIGMGTVIDTRPTLVTDEETAVALGSCDVVFGCVDSVEGRHALNVLTSAFLQPYFDVGVHLEPDGIGGLNAVLAAAHYVKPGGSSLLSRGVFTPAQLSAAGQQRLGGIDESIPQYLAAVGEDQPAVMPLNMLAASLGVNDFLGRLHGFRLDNELSSTTISLVHSYLLTQSEIESCPGYSRWVGLGHAAIPRLRQEMSIDDGAREPVQRLVAAQ